MFGYVFSFQINKHLAIADALAATMSDQPTPSTSKAKPSSLAPPKFAPKFTPRAVRSDFACKVLLDDETDAENDHC